MDVTSIVNTFIGTVGTIGAAIIAKGKITTIINRKKGTSKLNELIEKSASEKTIKDLLEQLREEYGADRTLLYYFHNGTRAANNYSFYKVSCMYESWNKALTQPIREGQQNMPIMLLTDFLVHYKEIGIVKCPDKHTYDGDIKNMKAMMDTQGVQSTYSMLFYDLDERPICTLVMNFMADTVAVEDFVFFNKVGTACGALLTHKTKY